MCGLYASIGFAPEKDRISIIAHRGPDGDGWREFDSPAGKIALGHRRLSIIDLSDAALQPMADPSGTAWLIFNGEIYNFLELREELRARGEIFVTSSDSEVLLRAYMVWGHDCLPRLRGMFAFVIWDEKRKSMFAARDRFGIKPLYFAETHAGIAFGSEIKQLLGLAGLETRMNAPRIHDFLASGVANHTDETMFDRVRQLRGGERAVIDCSDKSSPRLTVRRWYPVEADTLRISEAEASSRFRTLFNDSIRLHLRSDVPVGSCLSGGLDSSSIVCTMSEELRRINNGASSVNTISACYSEKSVDEKPFMDAVARHAGTIPHYIYPKAEDVFARAEKVTWHQDEPFGSTSIFAQWCVFEEAKRVGVKVMLDGQGADEQLAGYHGGFHYHFADLARRKRRLDLLRAFVERKRYHGASFVDQYRTYFNGLGPPGILKLLPTPNSGPPPAPDWLASEYLATKGASVPAVAHASDILGLPPVTDLRTLCLTLTFASNLAMLLHWEDRNSMAHSIEARVPFLDHPLVEFNLALGNDHKIVGGDTKRVLRRAMKGLLPDAVRMRRDKLGFATPESIWFRGPLRDLVVEGVESTLSLYPDIVVPNAARTLVHQMLNNQRPLDFSVWRMVNLGLWGRLFKVAQ